MAIPHKELVKVLCSRYSISASEAASIAKDDLDMKFFGQPVRTPEDYHHYLDGLEAAGSAAEVERK